MAVCSRIVRLTHAVRELSMANGRPQQPELAVHWMTRLGHAALGAMLLPDATGAATVAATQGFAPFQALPSHPFDAECHRHLGWPADCHVLALPLNDGGELRGVIAVGRETPFDREEGCLLEALAAHAALTLPPPSAWQTAPPDIEGTELAAALRRAQEALSDTENERRKLATVMEAAPAAIVLLRGPEPVIEYANQQAQALISPTITRDCVRENGAPFRRSDGSSYQWEELPGARALCQGETLAEEEMILRLPDGGERILEVNAAPVQMRGGKQPYAVVAMHDVTEERRAERRLIQTTGELARRTARLHRANEELQQFASVVSHDLKAPLRAVDCLAHSIAEELGPQASGEVGRQLGLLRGRIHRMDQLITGLLEYSRAGHHSQLEPTNVRELVNETVQTLPLTSDFRIELTGEAPVFETDRLHLGQVLANLIGNAVKHHDRSNGLVRIHVEQSADHYRFSVSDDGPGIAPEHQEKIFDMFQTLKQGDSMENTGIGLALVKKLVEHRGGALGVESASGKGATFHFTWPKEGAGGVEQQQ